MQLTSFSCVYCFLSHLLLCFGADHLTANRKLYRRNSVTDADFLSQITGQGNAISKDSPLFKLLHSPAIHIIPNLMLPKPVELKDEEFDNYSRIQENLGSS